MTVYRCTSSARVDVYQKNSVYTMTTSSARETLPDNPQIVQIQCFNNLAGGGGFSFVCKSRDALNYARIIQDDDWVDISFGKNGVYWHTMRGVVDDVRVSTEATGQSITTTLVVSGRSFQKAWETTTSYFFEVLQENLLLDAIAKVSGGMTFLRGSPEKNVRAVLFSLFDYIGTLPLGSRANWLVPNTLPTYGVTSEGIAAGTKTLADIVLFDQYLVDDTRVPASERQDKSAFAGNSIFGGQSLWQLAKTFCDEMFCELYTDVLPAGGTQTLALDTTLASGLSTGNSVMSIVQRDKPFMLVSPDVIRPTNQQCSYFLLPLYHYAMDEVRSFAIGKNGMERFNCFNVAPPSNSDIAAGSLVSLRYPIWSAVDMALHGLRRMDAQTVYLSENPGNVNLIRAAQRSQLCDFYCLNAEFFAGTVVFANPHPEIRIGTRLRLSPNFGDDFEAYVEGVTHTWSVNHLTTQVQVTRGFFGSPNNMLLKLAARRADYDLGDTVASATSGEITGVG